MRILVDKETGEEFYVSERSPNDKSNELLVYPLEPKQKPVDMDMLIGTKIDCVFYDHCYTNNSPIVKYFGALNAIAYGDKYVRSDTQFTQYCKPRMNYWFAYCNFESEKVLSDLLLALEKAGFKTECAFNGTQDIQAFCITGLQEGYCWPWEAEEQASHRAEA